ncbi:MAG TPA: hypothetical protein VFV50_17825, partial [Bdellovibrionales bacterium]|nr:hypothetical protein [Bdellovibrionales bacterium]
MATKRKGFLLWLFLFFVLLAGLAVFLAVNMAEPKIKALVETHGSQAIGGTVRVGSVKVSYSPLGLAFNGIQASGLGGVQAKLPKVSSTLRIKSLNPPALHIVLIVDEPVISAELPLRESPAAKPTARESEGSSRSLPFSFDIAVNKGTIEVTHVATAQPGATPAPGSAPAAVTKLALTGLGVKLAAAGLAEPITLALQTNAAIERDTLKLSYPVGVAGQFQIENATQTFKVLKSTIDLGGINFSTTGFTRWKADQHEYRLVTNIPELKNLKAPPKLLPPGQWSGAILSSIKIAKEDRWTVQGNANIKSLQGQLDTVVQQAALKGTLTASASAEFAYDNELTVKSLKAQTDLKALGIAYKDLFRKPAGTPLGFNVDASMAKDLLELKTAEF